MVCAPNFYQPNPRRAVRGEELASFHRFSDILLHSLRVTFTGGRRALYKPLLSCKIFPARPGGIEERGARTLSGQGRLLPDRSLLPF